MIAGTTLLALPILTATAQAQLSETPGATELLAPVPAPATAAAKLFLLNGVQDPVAGTVELLDAAGQVLSRAKFEVQASDHGTFDLDDLHRGAPVASVRVSHSGGAYALSSWLALRRGHQVAELGLHSPGHDSGTPIGSFWHLTGRDAGARPVFYVLNTTGEAMRFEVVSSEARNHTEYAVPGHGVQVLRLSSTDVAGWLELHHDGPEGALLVTGLITGPSDLSVLPAALPSNASQASYASVRVPVVEEGTIARPETFLTLFNSVETASAASVEVFDAPTGTLLHRFEPRLAAREIASFELAALLGRSAAPTGEEVRLRIEGHHPGLRVSGFTRMSNGAVLDLAFFDVAKAHGSGHYPLVSLENNDVFLTMINLSAQDAQVVAQLFWDGGWTYSYGPLAIKAGASRRIDVRQLAEEAVPDMLGRTLDGRFKHGMLQWKVFEGEPAFVARTEVRPAGTADTFGFNCFGCCYEFPVASIIPSEVSFFLDQTPSFEAAITYETCSGTMGPYSATPTSTTVPAPFNWNTSNVGASDTAKDDLSFTDRVSKTTIKCETVFVDLTGIGTASSCKHLLRRPDNPTKTWNVNQTCVSQVSAGQCNLCQSCCDQILAWKQCTKIGLLNANKEHQACLANCATDIC